MWEYLYKVHNLLPLILVTGIVVAIMVISLKGKLVFRWGRNAIGIGKNVDLFRNKSSGGGSVRAPVKRRTCSDCLLIVTNEYERFMSNKQEQTNKLLNSRMNYTEEKLLELQYEISEMFDDRMNVLEKEKENENKIIIETKMFFGLLKEGLSQAKKEIRRSCKEDNFPHLSNADYLNYVDNKAKVIISSIISYLRNVYPSYGTLVPVDSIVEDIESCSKKIYDYTKEIFDFAKQILKEQEEEINLLEDKFKVWVDKFISPPSPPSS